MGDEARELVLKEVDRELLTNLLAQGKRMDERGLNDYRNVKVTKGVLSTAEGSALAQIGDTKVLCGVKFGEMTPFPDRPKEGVFMVMAEFLPLASPTFEPGPPSPYSIELARVVDRGIRSAEVIDTESMFIEEGKVLAIFIDLYVMDHGGNLTDTAALAAAAALSDTKVPKVVDGKIVRKDYTGPLKMPDKPVTSTFIKVGDKILLDPLRSEEHASDCQLTVGTIEGQVVCMQKSGPGSMKKSEVMECIDVALAKGKELRSYL
ncbi:MAG: exosome complex protein Rrp42 [Candidatus Micrarchaeia archaeon]|jgi:exosome complex component RRP42